MSITEPAQIIKDGKIVNNNWLLIDKLEDNANPVPSGQVIVHIDMWLEQKAQLSSRTDVGVWLDNTDTADRLGNAAQQLPLIAVNFPSFMDGRAFTAAQLLRERYGFTGELRAIGHFIRDQLFYLKRCGVNAFACGNDIQLDKALLSLQDFSESYQTAADTPIPLFRRRESVLNS